MSFRAPTALTLLLALFPAAAGARGKPADPPALRNLVACRAEPDPGKRLACFDTASAALERAVAAEDVAVIDQQQVRATREALFGLPTPRGVTLFGEGVSEVKGVVRDSSFGPDGSVTMSLESGQVWTQVDGRGMRQPRRGEAITIRRATLGRLEAVFDHGVVRQFRRVQ